MSAPVDLTICTVSFGHQELIELNLMLTRALNPEFEQKIKWLIADNAYENEKKRLKIDDKRVHVTPGISDASAGASQHHAVSLNALIGEAKTQYLLVLDPDFYILTSDWCSKVLNHMRRENLSFFGTPWNPRYNNNYRYFPAVHCMFVDLHRASIQSLDFRPLLDRLDTPTSIKGPLDYIPFLAKRRRVSWDTGTRIFEDYKLRKDLLSECTTPVFREDRGACGSILTKLLEPLLPDEYCYFPKNRNSYVTSGFYEMDLCPQPGPSHSNDMAFLSFSKKVVHVQ